MMMKGALSLYPIIPEKIIVYNEFWLPHPAHGNMIFLPYYYVYSNVVLRRQSSSTVGTVLALHSGNFGQFPVFHMVLSPTSGDS